MRSFIACAVVAFCSSPVLAQYISNFESLAGSAAGTVLTGQDGYYNPVPASSIDFLVHTYAGNPYGIAANPNGGNQFVTVTGPGGGFFGRAQRNITWGVGTGVWTYGFDVLPTFTGTLPATQNIGSFSMQPFPGSQGMIALATWTDVSTATAWTPQHVWHDAAGLQIQEIPDPSFVGLAAGSWYRWEVDVDLTSNQVLQSRVTNLSTSVTVVANPVGRYLLGGATPAPDPTGFRMFSGGGAVGNVLAFDNVKIFENSGREVTLLDVPTIGTSSEIRIDYPLSETGNPYALIWSTPYPDCTLPVIPGLRILGLGRIDTSNFLPSNFGVFGGSGSETHSVFIPPIPHFINKALDCQSIDLDVADSAVAFSDNEIEFVITSGLCEVNIATATTTSTTTGNNDLQSIDDNSIGAPVSQGLAPFSYLPTRHRGDEGFVEGYAGTFSTTQHNSDIDSVSFRRVARRLTNLAYQVVSCPNGYDISLIRDNAVQQTFSVLSYERATGTARIVPGTTWTISTGTTQQWFYPAFSRDGQWGAIVAMDTITAPGPAYAPRVLAFRTDGLSPAIDVTPAGLLATDRLYDGSMFFTADFLIVAGDPANWWWTSATAPATMTPLPIPNTAANGLPNIWQYPFSWRVSRDNSTAYLPTGGDALASRGEMDMIRITNNAGTPLATNYTQFAAVTGIAELGYSATSPSTANNSSTGIKASVSPDGTKIAFLGATTTTTAFPGLYVADGTANPVLRTVPGATFYSEVAFINNTTVLFFAGTSSTAQSFYSLDVPTGTITQIGAATDHRTRGQFWSLNKNWWYFHRSNSAGTINNFVAVDCATGAVHDVTGTEFGGGGPVGTIRTGTHGSASNVTTDPWAAVEMQLRRAPVGDFAYFTARRETGIASTFEDGNVFRFDIENGGTATMLTNNTGTGTGSVVLNIESLMISPDGNHLAWAQRFNTVSTTSEDVFHLDLTTNTLSQVSVSTPTGQTITDGSIWFTCGTPAGLVWSKGTGSTAVPTANARVEYVPLGSSTPILLTPAPGGTRLYQVIGTND